MIIVVWFNGHSPAITNIPGFATREQCVAMVKYVNKRDNTRDAYCIQVK